MGQNGDWMLDHDEKDKGKIVEDLDFSMRLGRI